MIPVLERAGPRAIASVDVLDTASGCSLEYSSVVPPSTDRAALRTGEGERLVDGDDAVVECRVQETLASPDIFDVDLLLEHDTLPRMTVLGSLGRTSVESRLVLKLVLPSAITSLQAECSAEAVQVAPGAAWFHLDRCVAETSDRLPDRPCGMESIEVSAIFEVCNR